MTRPNFIGLGVQRAATTWLHDCLIEHPDVFLPAQKELHFFNSQYELGFSWYEAQFVDHQGESAIGEITPLYLHTAPIARIVEACPQAKYLVILREPVDRAYSGYKLMQQRFFQGMSFSDAMKTGRGKAVIGYSMYAEKLKLLFDLVPRESVLVEIYDDVIREPQQLFMRVCQHLDVDSTFLPSRLNAVSNRIILPAMQQQLQQCGLGFIVDAVKATPFGDLVKRWSKRHQAVIDNSPELQAFRRANRDLFRSDILQTQSLIHRDLSEWMRRSS